jgi:choline dehydrogenase-like flavoprotein
MSRSGPPAYRGTDIATDICIVGAGPAGLLLAAELEGVAGASLVILESGARSNDPAAQELNEGPQAGDPYAGLRATRHRQTGGTVHLWNTPIGGRRGAKYAPLDPWDFPARPGEPDGSWPFGAEELEPWYRRAQQVCRLGPFAYAGESWTALERPLLLPESRLLTTRVYQAGLAQPFLEKYPQAVRDSQQVRLLERVTAQRLSADAAGRSIAAVEAVTADGRAVRVRARIFVLAAGAVENARLLLLSGLGERSPWVGRCFMEHPRDSSLSLIPSDPDFAARAGFYDMHQTPDGTVVGGRLALTAEAVLEHDLPNASVTLLPEWDPPASRMRRLLSLLGNQRMGGYGWWERLQRGGPRPDRFRLLINLEQRPHPDNRITLAEGRDRFGTPRAALSWRWRPEEQARLDRLRAAVAGALEQSGLGRVEQAGGGPDPNAHHHSGTTRMHDDPERGVADRGGRVHGADNLYLAGASLFPSAGFANPTLTIVALTLRLAEHLRRNL